MSNVVTPETDIYLNELQPQRNVLLAEMEQFAKEKRIPILESPAAKFLHTLVRLKNPSLFLEIGTAIGYSTIIAAAAAPKEAEIYSIEKSQDNLKLAKEYIRQSGFEEKITLLEGDAAEILSGFGPKCDIIFLDADKEDYDELFMLSLNILADNGIILIDNLLWHGYTAGKYVPESYEASTEIIRAFNKKIANLPGYEFTLLTIGDGLGIVMPAEKGA